jgi:hypothetical protein
MGQEEQAAQSQSDRGVCAVRACYQGRGDRRAAVPLPQPQPQPLRRTRRGLLQSHARATHVTRLSHSPCESLASVFADSGANTSTSAQRRSSMCNTGSPTARQAAHSSSSRAGGGTAVGSAAASTKRAAAVVHSNRTSPRRVSSAHNAGTLMAATLPAHREWSERSDVVWFFMSVRQVVGCDRQNRVAARQESFTPVAASRMRGRRLPSAGSCMRTSPARPVRSPACCLVVAYAAAGCDSAYRCVKRPHRAVIHHVPCTLMALAAPIFLSCTVFGCAGVWVFIARQNKSQDELVLDPITVTTL